MPKQQTVIQLDAIDRKKQIGLFGRLLITRWHPGKKSAAQEKYGHYLFTGRQRSGKTAGSLWFTEQLIKRYKRKKYAIRVFSNIGIGESIQKDTIYQTIDAFDPYAKEVRIVIIDEIQSYFSRGSSNKKDKAIIDDLIGLFSQLAKRNTYILSTAQVYGRLDKSLREQCLYMINCKKTITGKFKNEFIDGDDIICDELGRWAGRPSKIYIHGLPKLKYDTKKLIRE